jgi:hypothetical protein
MPSYSACLRLFNIIITSTRRRPKRAITFRFPGLKFLLIFHRQHTYHIPPIPSFVILPPKCRISEETHIMNISSGHATTECARSRNWFFSCFLQCSFTLRRLYSRCNQIRWEDLEYYARVCEKLALSVSRYIPGISVERPRPRDCDHILRRR